MRRFRFLILAVAFAVVFTPTLLGCGGGGSDDDDGGGASPPPAAVKTMEFTGVPTPTTDAEKRAVLASPSVEIDGETHAIGFHTILRSGDQRGDGVFGKIYDFWGNPVLQTDGSSTISNDNDHSTLIDLFGKVFMVSQFESRPAAFYITELDQNPDTGELTAIDTKPIDFAGVYGGWVHCAGMRTPWKSHLGSEEYEPDARMCNPVSGVKTPDSGNYYGAMAAYFGGDHTQLNPYNYGYVVEVKVNGPNLGSGTFASNVSVEKHYCMGRVALELAYVMPDRRTVYLTDDGTMVGLFKFVADTAGDLSAGTLYVARMKQTSSADGGSFTISWIDLGHATDSEIRALIDGGGAGGGKITFADIFDAVDATADPITGNYSVPAGYAGVSHGHDKMADGTYNEGLRLRTGMEKAAACLETRRYAALMGGTMEFRKMEGITFNPDDQKLYLAMSEVSKGMLQNTDGLASKQEAFSGDHIRLPQIKAGTVYVLDVDSKYSATAMRGLVSGTDTTYPANSPYAGNTADVDGIANPDNVTYIPGYNTLIIGEDTGSGHQNDVIWAFNLDTEELTRIQTTPYGSETTSPYWYPDINGWGYLMSVIQHPYGESDQTAVEPGSAERRAYTGYVGPFPMDVNGGTTPPSALPLEFAGVPTPVTDDEKRAVLASPTVSVDGTVYDIGFHTILRSGDQRGEGVFGKIYDFWGDPVLQTDGSSTVSNDNDHSTLIDVFGKVFMVSQFESRPAAFYITELSQNAATGALTATNTKPIDFSHVFGGWVHCAGMRTPWKSHLGSEEYEPDARMCDPVSGIKTPDSGNYYGAMADYFKGDHTRLNPYNYGYVVEVTVTDPDMGDGTFASNVTVEKHYCMGRMALELAYVMPDGKTAYLTDDGTMVGLFKFVADTAGDLSAGTLYVARMTQTSAADGGSFTIAWIELGHATDAEIRALIDSGGTASGVIPAGGKIEFADIFDAVNPTVNPTTGDYEVPGTHTGVSHGHDKMVDGTYNEGLMLMPGMEKAAAFLETRRYAAYLGGTMEFRKMEGITFDPDGQKLYLAMSEVSKGMLENTQGLASTQEAFSGDHIRLPQIKAGTVYELDVDGNYSATAMRGLVSGIDTTYPPGSPYAGNTADVDGISNPDNVTFIPGYNTLIIGEDTGSGHQNDVIWSYNLSTRVLTRIQTTPYGSETTSPYWYPNINGWGYLMSVIQHPYGESDQGAVEPGSAERRAYTGFVGPFPAMD
jgi:secreted PhoX family phosphatase